MAQHLGTVLDIQVMDLLVDLRHVESLTGQQQAEGFACFFHFGAGFQHGEDILFPVHLADEENDGIIAQVPAAGDLVDIGRMDGAEGCPVRDNLDFAFETVLAEHVG